jgi:hypothetical protein
VNTHRSDCHTAISYRPILAAAEWQELLSSLPRLGKLRAGATVRGANQRHEVWVAVRGAWRDATLWIVCCLALSLFLISPPHSQPSPTHDFGASSTHKLHNCAASIKLARKPTSTLKPTSTTHHL